MSLVAVLLTVVFLGDVRVAGRGVADVVVADRGVADNGVADLGVAVCGGFSMLLMVQ